MADCAKGCKIRDQHLTDCQGDCRGCLPRHTERQVCEKCEQRFPENLTAIIDAWEDLHRQVSKSSSFELRERVTGTADVGLVLNETVMDIMAEVRDWAIFVSRVISTERTGSGHPQSIDTPGLLKFVRVNAEWALEHELAGEFVNDAGFLKSLVHNTAYPSGARRLNLPKGRCTTEGCESGVVAILRPAGGKPSNVQCKADPKHVVDMTQSLNQDFVEWLKNDEVALILAKSVKTLYQLADRHGWAKMTIEGQLHYNRSDVMKYLEENNEPT